MQSMRNVPMNVLRNEISRREKGADKIIAKRDKIVKQLAELEEQLAEIGVEPNTDNGSAAPSRVAPRKAARSPVKGARRGPGRRSQIGELLEKHTKPGQVLSPSQALKLVTQKGFKSKSDKPGIIVAMRMASDPNFKRVGRGEYERLPLAK